MTKRRSLGPMLPYRVALALSIGLISQPGFAQLPWMNTSLSAEARTELLVRAMTLDEKIQQIANQAFPDLELPGCGFTGVGRQIRGIPRLAIPNFRLINGGNGVRGGACLPEPTMTGFPSAPLGAATFNPAVNFAWGAVLGQEVRNDAHHVLLGPALNLNRHPYNGRTQEYFSEDPYLAGVIGTEVTKGIQSQGQTHAMIKHFAGNDDEGGDFERWTRAVRIPARAMHELYLLPFEMAIRDGDAASVMCAYPHLNFAYACENQDLLITTLWQRWGFDGYVESDRRAQQSTVPSVLARVSVELDEVPEWYSPERVKAALSAGQITMADIDELLRRRYFKMFQFGHFDTPYNRFLPIDYSVGAAVARQAAEEGIVLLKNEGNFLPLGSNIRSVALIGAEWFAGMAALPPRNGQWEELATVISPPQFTISPEQGLRNTLAEIGSAATVTYNNGSNIASAVALARQSDVVVLMVGNTPRETRDIPNLSLPVVPAMDPPEDDCDPSAEECPGGSLGPLVVDQEALVPAILAANPNTVVVLKTGGMVLMPWLNNARALVEAWFPGQHDGDAVADILFGVINPSGKLPVTFGNTAREAAYATEAQYPGIHENTGVGGGKGRDPIPGAPQLVTRYTEDLQMGYRWYEANGVTPLFPFGFGLSYTTFAYSGLSVATRLDPRTDHAVLTVTYTITNTGSRRGAEVSQVYLTLPPVADEPSKRLVGFQRVNLDPGASQLVTVTIDSSAPNHPLSYFQPDPNGTWAHGNWVTPAGTYTVHVGRSSADTPLRATVNLSVVTPPVSLRLVPGILDLRGAPGRVTAVLSVSAPYSLLDLHVTNVRFEGAPALTTALSTDGRAMVATFDASRLTQLAAGQNVIMSLAADVVKDGTEDKLWATTTATVLK
ncbi:MAG: glycoside hydrolase family 3 C-terminal domain-containing protein [Bryobacteraceae bacterium]